MASSASEFRRNNTTDVALSGGLSVTIQARDFLTLFLEGVFETPLLSAFQKLIEQAPLFLDNPGRIAEMSVEERRTVLSGLRQFACAVIESPTFVLVPDDHPDHVPIAVLNSDDLLAVWVEGNALIGLKANEVMAKNADRFRRSQPNSNEPAAPGGEVVRDEAERVVPHADGKLIHQ